MQENQSENVKSFENLLSKIQENFGEMEQSTKFQGIARQRAQVVWKNVQSQKKEEETPIIAGCTLELHLSS